MQATDVKKFFSNKRESSAVKISEGNAEPQCYYLWSVIGTSNRGSLDTLNIDEIFAELPLKAKASLSSERETQASKTL